MYNIYRGYVMQILRRSVLTNAIHCTTSCDPCKVYTTRNLQLQSVVREATDDNDDRAAGAIHNIILSCHNFAVYPVSLFAQLESVHQ